MLQCFRLDGYDMTKPVPEFRFSLEKYYDREINIMLKWCQAILEPNAYGRIGQWPGYIYFKDESDLNAFTLVWGR